jgi:tRNA-dihydrouridine synthase C
MEGVVDHAMRDMLSQIGGLDRCVTEFVRVTEQVLPPKVFYRLCPELHNGGQTAAGTPVYIQLLGSHPQFMATNAAKAAALGAPGIDINFGCPAKTVNKSDGGSILLREPKRLATIVDAIRQQTPSNIPVTAKIRLGFDDCSLFEDIVGAIIEAGANELVIHARTKVDGYKPPAYWQHLQKVSGNSPIPVIANGEIWTVDDYQQCQQQSGCQDIMLGRGLLASPGLARSIRQHHTQKTVTNMSWLEVLLLLEKFADTAAAHYDPRYIGNRVKQWLGYLRQGPHHEAKILFEQIKRLRSADEIQAQIQQALAAS